MIRPFNEEALIQPRADEASRCWIARPDHYEDAQLCSLPPFLVSVKWFLTPYSFPSILTFRWLATARPVTRNMIPVDGAFFG